jgi:hypothetical protein
MRQTEKTMQQSGDATETARRRGATIKRKLTTDNTDGTDQDS